MIKNRLPLFLVAAVACSPVLAENPSTKPLPESDLLKQIEAIKPAGTPAAASAPPVATAVPVITPAATEIIKLPGDSVLAPGATDPAKDKKAANVTEITAIEATFDQKANVAVFLTNVVVKDPQFNVECDKLTAYLKKNEQAGTVTPRTEAPVAKPINAPLAKVTPTPAPKGSPAPANAATAPKKQGSGLDKAVAVTTSDRRVRITQDKVEADGSITHGIGIADRAEYYSSNGDIYLYGMPDVTQGTNRCIATAPETWMKLNRDGHMEAHGPHRTLIVSDDQNRQSNASTPAPGSTPR